MAFDQPTRNRLARFVSDARRLISEEFTFQFQSIYGISATGHRSPLDQLGHLDEIQRTTAAVLHERIHYLIHSHSGETKPEAAAVDRLVREHAFTVLNRLAAIRMAEKRGLIVESVGKGYQSKGFQVYSQVAGSGLGETFHRYRRYLFCLFDELAVDLGILFDRRSPSAILFPREQALLDLLALLNAPDLDALWAEDETIGWIYQYYNDPEERKKMREASAAPRNSRELAVRNQFFTPRYVVEFLTDNTLGRLWYEMTRGETALRESCRYIVRRPTEIFLNPGESAPENAAGGEASVEENFSQEELLRQPVRIPHRPLKDPREIRLLDPACGSMHFGLYAFDLFTVLYDEAWEIARGSDEAAKSAETFAPFVTFAASFPEKAAFLREVPRLIVEHNIHGIDIDPRAVQIAGLSLWLRAQRAWHEAGVKAADRPRIIRSNLVCAEPMPGDKELLREFVEQQFPTGERPAFSFLLEKVFDRMTLAGEAGSLLRIEEEIRSAITEARALAEKQSAPRQAPLFPEDVRPEQAEFNLRGLTDEQFWHAAEQRIYDALETYAEQAENGGGFQRRLFADDAAQGFAFIDLLRKRYDVALMNPPFGDASLPSKPYIDATYGDTKGDVYKAFVECFHARLISAGYLGIISSRTGFFLGQSEDWRTRVVLRLFRPIALADLGSGVLDAMVEVAAYVLRSLSEPEARDLTLSLVPVLEKVVRDKQDRFSLPKWQAARGDLKRHQAVAELEHLEANGFIQRCPGEIVRYTPLWHAAKEVTAPPKPVYPELVCVRAIGSSNKATMIQQAVGDWASGDTFVCNPGSFLNVPGGTFAYWVRTSVTRVFSTLKPMESDGRTARQGLSTADDFRFARLFVEIPMEADSRWMPFAKGGAFSRFYADVHLMVNWGAAGEEMKLWASSLYNGSHWSRIIKNVDCYFRAGLTWPRRTTSGLALRVLPRLAIFADKGPALFVAEDSESELLAMLALMNSRPFSGLVALQIAAADAAARSYEVGVLQRTPIPELTAESSSELSRLALTSWIAKRELDTANPFSHAYTLPVLLALTGATLTERAAAWATRVRTSEETGTAVQAEIDHLAFRLYGLDVADRAALTATLATETTSDADAGESDEDEEEEAATADITALTADLLAYAVGCAFGRWDIRFATRELPAPPAPDPFAPLPVCPPGMLQGDDGLPLSPEAGRRLRAEDRYPLDVAWDGILVDDPEHPLDLEGYVRAALVVLWGDRADDLEHEACTLLAVPSFREWFRRPAGFFGDHLKRYSKSRRKAPIYWPLSTASGSYTLWLYYHRLTPQTLHTVIADFLDPKIKALDRDIAALREASGGGTGSRLGELLDFQDELKALRVELERVIKLPWRPNLNDGVLITASPLWKLFRLGKWQKDLKACWEALEKGDYDWAHLAYSIWPDRVREKCLTDRSLAIAHGLEELCEVAAPAAKAPRRAKRDAAATDRETRRAAVLEELTEALANIFQGKKIPLDAVNAQTGEIIIPANRKITKTLLRKLAYAYGQIDIDPSPYRNKVREIIAQFEPRLAEFTDNGAIPNGSRELFP